MIENRKGEFTLNGAFILLLVIALLVLALSCLSIGLTAIKLNTMNNEIVRHIEIRGQVDGSEQDVLNRLNNETNCLAEMSISAGYSAGGTRIQFGDTFSVTLTCEARFGIGGVLSVPVQLHSTVTGRSERYWK